MNHLTFPRSLAAAALASALAFGLSACGSSNHESMNITSTTVSTSADHNSADVSFLNEMIPHHAGALEMSKLAATNASSQDVKTLAKQIEAAQQPEIDTMNRWLQSWGQPTIDPNMSTEHMGHSGSTMPGMMSADDMSKLQAAKGPDFDKMFLQMMTEHHQGAIQMAQTEMRDGKSADAKALAQSIATSQQKEVDHMQSLLSQA